MGHTRSAAGEALPTSRSEFCKLVTAARTENEREHLRVRVCRELPRYDTLVRARRLHDAARTPPGRIFEERLLEFVRKPSVYRDYGWELDLSHDSAWSDLAEMRSRRFVAMLRGWVAGGDRRLAARALRQLAWVGMEADLSRLLRALADGPWTVRGEVAQGAQFGAEDGHLSARMRRRLFDATVPLVCGEVPIPRKEPLELVLLSLIEAMVALDRREAAEILSGDRALHSRNPAVGDVLRKLVSQLEERPRPFRPVDPGVLWPVYEAGRGRRLRLRRSELDDDWCVEQAMADCLALAADRDPVRTASECRAVLNDRTHAAGRPLKLGAKGALKRCGNVPEPEAVLQAFWRRPAAFRGEAAKVIHAYALLDHVLSDGLVAYFDNMGDDWAAAHEGLMLIGRADAAAIVAEGSRTVMAFATAETRRSVRAAALNMDKAATRRLEALNDRFYRHIDSVRSAVERYIGQHPAAFKAAAPKNRKG